MCGRFACASRKTLYVEQAPIVEFFIFDSSVLHPCSPSLPLVCTDVEAFYLETDYRGHSAYGRYGGDRHWDRIQTTRT